MGIAGFESEAVGTLSWNLAREGREFAAFLQGTQELGAVAVRAIAPPSPDGWTHLAAVNDGRSWTLFFDGRAVATAPIASLQRVRAPLAAQLMLGRAGRFTRDGFVGELDEFRVWKRALRPAEIVLLARRESPPRFALSRGTYTEKDDLAAALAAEFGSGAVLADWDDLRRWHADDTRAWAAETGLLVGVGSGMIARGGERFFEGKRQYFINRFDGNKPGYFLAHAERGGATLALGSWSGGAINLLVRLPASPSRREQLRGGADGTVVRELPPARERVALELSWRARLDPARARDGVQAELTLLDGRRLRAICTLVGETSVAVALGDAAAPQFTRQHGASYGEFAFTLVVQDGRLKLRAVNAVGAAPLFQDEVELPGLIAREVVRVTLPGVDAAELIIE